jgi:hypothetical protein
MRSRCELSPSCPWRNAPLGQQQIIDSNMIVRLASILHSGCTAKTSKTSVGTAAGSMSVNAWRGDHPLDGFESKSEHVTMSISAEQISTEPITRQVARLFLCGDVMTGRGIDQILPHPCDPLLHESYVKSARDYIRLAEQVNGRIPKAVKFSYVWGAALQELTRAQPDVRIINLETSITRRGAFVPKGINYRMSPERRLSRVCRYRLLCARQQPYFRLGACWAGRHAGKSGASADRVSGSRA